MFFGGRSYPDATDCAAMGTDIAQTMSATIKRRFKAFWAGMSSLLSNSSAMIDRRYFVALGS
jgi:hypothetical protein